LITPVPLISTLANAEEEVMVNALASGWKTMLSRVILLVTVTFV
jgi:hypothetical protein